MLLRPLSDDDDRTNFTCGDAALDDFFRMRAGQNQFKHRTSVTYVLVDGRELGGFVTVLPGTVRRVDLGIAHRRLPPGALPVLVIARMGVATSRQRQGLGARLLAGALDVALELVDRVGCVGAVVDAKEGAYTFYERFDFAWLPIDVGPGLRRGFLPIQTIQRAREKG